MAPKRTKIELQSDLASESNRRMVAEDELWLHNRAMEYADNGIIITDNLQPDNPIIYANQAFLAMTGYALEEVIGRNCRFMQGTDTSTGHVAELGAAVAREAGIKMTLLNYTKSGRAFWNELSIAPVPDPSGVITHFIGAQRDVTEIIDRQNKLKELVEQRTLRLQNVNEELALENRRRQSIELELMIKQRQLEFSNYELEQFASVASHDLQEPLRMVASYLSLIERRYASELDSDGLEFLNFAVDGAARMKRLITDLSVYARLDRENDSFSPVSLVLAARGAVADLEVKIKETNAVITIQDLPTINGDISQMTQMFQNLISNALKYRSANPPEIIINAEYTSGEIVLSVRDNGIGIAEREHERIFLVFRQVERTSRENGSGIGLAIVKKIVVRHGGRIWVESDVGNGSTFKIAFPFNNQERKNSNGN